MDDFTAYLKESFAHIPPILISDEIKNKYLIFASHLPDTFAHYLFGYEKHLNDNKPVMDMCISATNRELYSFSSAFNYPALNELTSLNNYWKNLQGFAGEWSDKRNPITKLIEIAILEIDAVSLYKEVTVPSVFLGIETVPDSGKTDYNEIIFNRLKALIYSLGLLSGKQIERSVSELLKCITKELPGNCQISQAGLMLSRPSSPLKICIKKFQKNDLINFIPQILDKGNLKDRIIEIVERYGSIFDSLVLVLDISGSDIIRAGVECYFYKKKQPPGEKRWKEVFDILIKDGLCNEEYPEPILNFPVKHYLFNIAETVPEYYAQGLHHIKFVTEGVKTSAKAYFWSGFHWKD